MTNAESPRDPDWEGAAALLGAERVVLARPAPPDWSLAAARLQPRDQLYRALLTQLERPAPGSSPEVVDTSLLGDAGLRIRAAGVDRLLVVPGPEAGSLVIAENPAGRADPSFILDGLAALSSLDGCAPEAAAASAAASASASAPGPLPAAVAPGPLPATAAADAGAEGRDLVGAWLAAMTSEAGQPLASPLAAQALARTAGVDLAVFVWPEGREVMAGWGAAAGTDVLGRGPLEVAWPLPDDYAPVGEALDALTSRPPTAPWRIVVAERGSLAVAVAVSPPHPAPGALAAVADVLAFDVERSRNTREGRQQGLLEERVRIAGLIHDGVTQQVSNVVIHLQLLELAAQDPERLTETLRSAREATSSALEELRASLYELAPRLTTNQDLVPTLQQWCEDYSAQWGIGVTVEVDGPPRQVDPDTAMLAYAVVQECLTNVRKHAEADSATVRLGFGPAETTVEVADDGAGFDNPPADPAPTGRRMGLRLLRDRVRGAGGRMDVESRPGEGARVTVHLPV